VVRNGCVPSAPSAVLRETWRRDHGLSADDEVLFTAALFNPCKGHRYLLAALPGIAQRHPRARLVLAGAGVLESELRRQVSAAGLEQRVVFLGYRRDVRSWMQAADLCVLPSLAEGIPAVLLEAMMEGCPVVATDVGGIGEVLDRDGTSAPAAWLVPPADSAALSTAIGHALADAEERKARSFRAQERAGRLFSVDRMVRDTLHVYGEVLAERGLETGQPLAGSCP
jgi:glycosyltransferase involved in cell wall biosynthesis